MSEEAQDREKEIIAKMTKYFVPISQTDLANVVPENDRILCSLTVAGKLFADPRPCHILLTPKGIAYRFISTANTFQYWHSIPSRQIKFGKSKITIDGFKMFIDSKIDNYYPNDVYKLLRESFSPYCKILSRDFQSRLNEIRFLTNNGELIQSKISNINLNEFLHQIQSFYNAGFQELILPFTERLLNVIPKNELIPFLRFFVRIYIKKTDEIESQFRKNRKLNEMVLPRFKRIVEIYDTILEQDPTNQEILEKHHYFQNTYNYYTIPYKDSKRAYQLSIEAEINYDKKKYEKALYYFRESYKLNPYSIGIKERIKEIQDSL